MYLWFSFCGSSHFWIVRMETSVSQAHTHCTHTVFVVGPTCLWRVNGHLVGVHPNCMLALGSQLKGVGGERLQVLQQVRGGRLKAHFRLKGQRDSGRRQVVRKTKETG